MSVEQTEIITGRQKLEHCVTRLGKSFADLVRTVENNGDTIQPEDLTKTFMFLREVLEGSENKARLSLSTAVAANGGFSLDTYEPKTVIAPGRPAILGTSVVVGSDGRPEGRLIGEKHTRRNKTEAEIENADGEEFLED